MLVSLVHFPQSEQKIKLSMIFAHASAGAAGIVGFLVDFCVWVSYQLRALCDRSSATQAVSASVVVGKARSCHGTSSGAKQWTWVASTESDGGSFPGVAR